MSWISQYENLYEESAYFRAALDSMVRVMDDSVFGLAADARVQQARTTIIFPHDRPKGTP